jgi:hypothetical protein
MLRVWAVMSVVWWVASFGLWEVLSPASDVESVVNAAIDTAIVPAVPMLGALFVSAGRRLLERRTRTQRAAAAPGGRGEPAA